MKVASTLEQIKSKTKDFKDKYEEIRYSVTDALMAQIKEYETSIDNSEKFGVHTNMN